MLALLTPVILTNILLNNKMTVFLTEGSERQIYLLGLNPNNWKFKTTQQKKIMN